MARQPLYFKSILDFFDGPQNLVRLFGMSRSALYKWNFIPDSRAYQIEVLSKGKFKAKDIISWGEADLKQRQQVD